MKKYYAKAAALLLAAMTVFSTGCANQEIEQPQQNVETTSVSTAPLTTAVQTETTTVPTTAVSSTASSEATSSAYSTNTTLTSTTLYTTTVATTVPITTASSVLTQAAQPVSAEPVTFLNFKHSGYIQTLLPGIGQSVMLQYQKNGKTVCAVYDLSTQSITREFSLKNKNDQLTGIFSDGTIIVISYSKGNQLLFYPEGSTEPTVIKLDMECIPMLYTDSKNDCIYFGDDLGSSVKKIDRNGNVSTVISNEYIQYIRNIDVNRMIVRATAFSDEYGGNEADAVFSLETGELLYALPNDGMSFFSANDQSINMDYLYDSANEPMKLNVFDNNGNYLHSYSVPRKNKSDIDVFYYDNPACSIVPMSYNKNGTPQSLSYLDLKNGMTYESGIDFKKNQIDYCSHCYVKDAGCWITAANCKNGKNYTGKLLRTNPESLKNGKELDTVINKPEKTVPATVGEKYLAVRNKADEIEKEFGVRILVGNEVQNAAASAGYNLISSELYTEPETEMENLDELRKQLAMYPKDFFSHFKMSDGKYGLRISLVNRLDNFDDSSFSAAGVAYRSGAWYDIAFQSCYCSDPSMLHHEIWHNVENLTNKTNMMNEDEWNKLNPKKFKYTSDFDSYAKNGTDISKTLPGYWEKNKDYNKAYFVRDYSLVTPMEDRATLIECVFQYASDWYEEIKPEDAIAEMNKYPHIKAKLDYLAEISKREFGYVYWDEIMKAY